MVGIIHIYNLFTEKEFKEGTLEKRVAMFYAKYERCCEKTLHPEWHEKWEYTLPLVRELVTCDFQVTRLLVTETAAGGKKPYNYQVLNLEEIKHNDKLITLWLAIQNLWGYGNMGDHLHMREVGFEDNPAIQKSMRQFYSENPNEKENESVVKPCTIRYFNISLISRADGDEAYNNSTTTKSIIALIY